MMLDSLRELAQLTNGTGLVIVILLKQRKNFILIHFGTYQFRTLQSYMVTFMQAQPVSQPAMHSRDPELRVLC